MKKKKSLPKAAVIGLIVVGALVVGLVGRMVLISPQKAKAASLTKQAADTRAQIATLQQEVRDRNSVPKIRVAEVYRLQKAMPSAPDQPDLLLELDGVARDAGIVLDQIGPQVCMPTGSYSKCPVHLTFDGTFYTVTDLLFRLRNLVSVHNGRLDASGRLFSVDQVTLTPKGKILGADITVNAYVYGGTPPPAPAPVPGATTSTDTTATATTPAPAASGATAAGAPSG
jgi:hypothetical protein